MQEESGWSDLPEHEKRLVLDVAKKNLLKKEPETMKQSAVKQLGSIIEAGKKELAYADFGDRENPTRVQKRASTGGFMDLRELSANFSAPGNVRALVLGDMPGRVIDVESGIIKNSRVAQAGAAIIFKADPPAAVPGPIPVMQLDAGAFCLIESSKFETIADGADAVDATLPVYSASISWPEAPSSGWTTVLTRRQQKDHGFPMDEAVFQAILLGLAREADRVLLTAIASARAANAFSIGAAAARGLRWDELKAFVGTSGTGAAIGGDGLLRAGGVVAELTDTVSGTIAGAWNRAAVAVHPQIRVVVDRLNLHSDLRLTCYANLLPLLPDSASAFWMVTE